MKLYRIYPDYGRGYQETFYATTMESMFEWLDGLIIGTKIPRILVIEHDSEIDCDIPMYLYKGDELQYLSFRKEQLELLKQENKTR